MAATLLFSVLLSSCLGISVAQTNLFDSTTALGCDGDDHHIFPVGQSDASGYLCTSQRDNSLKPVVWVGVLHNRTRAVGLKIDWTYSPQEVVRRS